MSIALGSGLHKKILVCAFSHPDEEYYVRELATILNDDPGNLSRELKKLEKEGLFISKVRGRIKLYSLNKKYPVYDELKRIVFKTEGAEGSLKEIVRIQNI